MRIIGFLLLALGVVVVLFSLLLLGFAALGLAGVLADVGPAENRAMGLQLLWMGLPLLIGGVVLCVPGFLAFARATSKQPPN